MKMKDISWYDDDSSSFTLTTANQLGGLAYLVKDEKKEFEGKTVNLGGDIDLSAHYWIPIGSYPYGFKGIFDGHDHKIINMEIETDSEIGAGLFAYASYATIQNVAVSGSITATGSSSKYNVGGIVGYSIGVTFINCVSSVAISSSMTVSTAEFNIGGIAGYSSCVDDSYINDCHFHGTINATTSGSGPDVGGICGYSKFCDVNNSANTGSISGYQAAGIVGGGEYIDVYNSYNSGKITGSLKGNGILGYAKSGWHVVNCYNVGNTTDRQVFTEASYSYGSSEYEIPVSDTPYSSYCKTSCGVFSSSGSLTSLSSSIIDECTTLVCALNAWIDEQPLPSLYTRWKQGSQLPAEFVDDP